MSSSLYFSLWVEACCDMAALALIFHEYMITFDREVALVWGRKFTGATVLFLLNRYLALFKYPMYIVNLAGQVESYEGCNASNILSMIFEILPYFVWISFSVLRVYAICGHNWRFALLVAVPGCVPLASNMYLYAETYTVNFPPPLGCLWFHRVPKNIYSILLIFTRSSVIVTDLLVLTLTWWRTYGVRKAVAEANIKISLATLLLRDGTIYFLVLLVMNTFHIAFSLTGHFTWTITLEEPLTTILISRFLLNLREADSRNAPDSSTGDVSWPSFIRHPDASNSLGFVSSFIAPLGAPLGHGGPTDSGNDEYERNDASEPTVEPSYEDTRATPVTAVRVHGAGSENTASSSIQEVVV